MIKKWKKAWHNLVYGGLTEREKSKNLLLANRIHLLVLFISTGVALGLPLAVLDLVEGNTAAATATFLYWVFLIVVLNYLYITRNFERAATAGITGTFVLFTYLLFSGGGADKTGIFWFLIFPALAIFLKGKHIGFRWAMGAIIGIELVFFMQALGYLKTAYDPTIAPDYAAALLVIAIFSYIFEDVNESNQRLVKQRTKELESEAVRDQAIFHSMGAGLVVLGHNKEIVFMNDLASGLLRVPPAEAVGLNYEDIIRFKFQDKKMKDKETPIEVSMKEKRGVHVRTEDNLVLFNEHGAEFPVGMTVTLLEQLEELSAVVVFSDISREKRLDEAKTEFVSLASHQLLTPLSTMRWYTELASEEAVRLGKEKFLQELVGQIDQSGKRLTNLVQQLLNISRLEAGNFAISPQKLDLREVVDEALEDLSARLNKRKLTVTKNYEDAPRIHMDRSIFYMVAQNLIDNAIKYTPDGGKITISLRNRDHTILFKVEDTGIGIPEKGQKQIFRKLYRADNARKRYTAGSGLGLYIVKQLVNHLNGHVWLESKEGEGTTFYVSIPSEGIRHTREGKPLALAPAEFEAPEGTIAQEKKN